MKENCQENYDRKIKNNRQQLSKNPDLLHFHSKNIEFKNGNSCDSFNEDCAMDLTFSMKSTFLEEMTEKYPTSTMQELLNLGNIVKRVKEKFPSSKILQNSNSEVNTNFGAMVKKEEVNETVCEVKEIQVNQNIVQVDFRNSIYEIPTLVNNIQQKKSLPFQMDIDVENIIKRVQEKFSNSKTYQNSNLEINVANLRAMVQKDEINENVFEVKKIKDNQSIVQMDTIQKKESSLFELDINAENLIKRVKEKFSSSKIYQCNTCAKQFSRKSSLKRHQLIHANELRHELPQHEMSWHEMPRLDLPQHKMPQQEMPQHEMPQHEMPQHEMPQHELSQHELPQHELLQHELPQHETSWHEMPQLDLPQHEMPQHEMPQQELPQHELPQHETPQLDLPQPELPQHEWSHHELPQQELPKHEMPQQEVPQHEMPHLDPQHELPQHEMPQHGMPQLDPQHELPQQELPQHELPQHELLQHELPQHKMPQLEPEHEMPQLDLHQPELPQHEWPEHELPQQELPQHEMPQHETPQLDLPQHELPQHELPQQELPQQEMEQHEMSQLDLPQHELSQHKLPQNELPQNELPQHELPRHKLTQHEPKHGKQPFACKVCDKIFTSNASLKRHKTIHTGDKPYSCQFCNKTFRLKQHLKVHERYHTGEKPFNCKICNKSFADYSNKKDHEFAHKRKNNPKEKLISCNLIDLVSLANEKMIKKEDAPSTYACNYCGEQFNQYLNMQRHQLNHLQELSERLAY